MLGKGEGMSFKDWFKAPIEGNIIKRLFAKLNNWQMDRLFRCPICKKGSIENRHGYFECPVCKHEFKGKD